MPNLRFPASVLNLDINHLSHSVPEGGFASVVRWGGGGNPVFPLEWAIFFIYVTILSVSNDTKFNGVMIDKNLVGKPLRSAVRIVGVLTKVFAKLLQTNLLCYLFQLELRVALSTRTIRLSHSFSLAVGSGTCFWNIVSPMSDREHAMTGLMQEYWKWVADFQVWGLKCHRWTQPFLCSV
jgi:hypothetical protein